MQTELASGSSLAEAISVSMRETGDVPREVLARLAKQALANAPPGVYLLDGYSSSEAALKAMSEEVGHVPKLALLLEMSDEAAATRLAEAGGAEPDAITKFKQVCPSAAATVFAVRWSV